MQFRTDVDGVYEQLARQPRKRLGQEERGLDGRVIELKTGAPFPFFTTFSFLGAEVLCYCLGEADLVRKVPGNNWLKLVQHGINKTSLFRAYSKDLEANGSLSTR